MSVSKKLLMTTSTKNPFFAQTLYTGNSVNFRSFNMGQPTSIVINKSRNQTTSFCLTDVVRGVGLPLRPDNQLNESDSANTIREFTFNGFKTGTSSLTNQSSYTYVAYSFSTGGAATVSNTEGSLTSSVNASVDNGFSICTYTGNGTNGSTFGHGLENTPELVIVKRRDAQGNWWVRGSALATGKYLQLDLASPQAGSSFIGQTSTVVEVNSDADQNTSGGTYVAYCFHSVTGRSKIGTYTGNGNATGPSVSLGFKPVFLLIKSINTGEDWMLYDSSRDSSNPRTTAFRLNLSNVEETYGGVDFNASSFQIKSTVDELNTNAQSYLYLAISGD